MAGSSTCYTSLQLCAARTSRLTLAGAPLTGAGNGYTTDAAIKLDVAVELSTGDDFEQKNGCGAICAAFKQPDRIKRLNLSLDLCQLDSELIAQLTDGDTFSTGGDVVGYQYPAVQGDDPTPVCFEGWSKAWDGSNQAVPGATSPDVAYFHWVFPFTTWTLGTVTVENALMVVPVTGQASENENITQNGPFDDWPSYISTAGGITRVGGWFLDSDIPTATCGAIAVTSAAS